MLNKEEQEQIYKQIHKAQYDHFFMNIKNEDFVLKEMSELEKGYYETTLKAILDSIFQMGYKLIK